MKVANSEMVLLACLWKWESLKEWLQSLQRNCWLPYLSWPFL